MVFLNLVPYDSAHCSGVPKGNGYSIIIDTCFTFDQESNFKFTVRESQNVVSWDEFESNNGSTLCNEQPIAPTKKAALNSCIPFIGNLDNYNKASILQSTWYKVSITKDKPIIPSNTYANSFSSKCSKVVKSSENSIAYAYFTNGTVVNNNNDGYKGSVYFCKQGVPYSQNLEYNFGPFNEYKLCSRFNPMFNSSWEYPATSACASGGPTCDSTGTGSLSGKVSGGSGSNTNSGFVDGGLINKNGDIYANGGIGDSDDSSDNGDNPQAYLNVYCS